MVASSSVGYLVVTGARHSLGVVVGKGLPYACDCCVERYRSNIRAETRIIRDSIP